MDITIPLIRPGLFAAIVLGAILSIGELAITVFIAGSSTTTVPLRIFSEAQYSYDPTIAAVSTILIVLALPVLFAIERFVGFTEAFK